MNVMGSAVSPANLVIVAEPGSVVLIYYSENLSVVCCRRLFIQHSRCDQCCASVFI